MMDGWMGWMGEDATYASWRIQHEPSHCRRSPLTRYISFDVQQAGLVCAPCLIFTPMRRPVNGFVCPA